MLKAKWADGKFVCVGLDPDISKIPKCVKEECAKNERGIRPFDEYNPDPDIICQFCVHIVAATRDLACAFKPNSAFFEAAGSQGLLALGHVMEHIREFAPDVPIIYDAKRADMGNTNAGYAKSAFELLGADAITVNPYFGREALQPFLDQKEKGIIVLCKTSNKGGGEFQDLSVTIDTKEVNYLESVRATPCSQGITNASTSMCNHVAYQVSRSWNGNNNCLLVVGATYPGQLQSIRKIVGDMPLLIPGIGTQGGDLAATVAAGKDSNKKGMIINSSSGIIFASSGDDFAEAARRKTLELHEAIQQCLK